MSRKIGNVCTIYKVFCNITNKVYIGQTWQKDLEGYFIDSHCCKRQRRKLYYAIKKYGRGSFTIEPLLFCDNQYSADALEIITISYFNSVKNGYNIRAGGNGGKISKESRKLMSERRKGRFGGENHPMWGKKTFKRN